MNHAEKVARVKSMLMEVAPHHDLEGIPGAAPEDADWTEMASPQRRISPATPNVGFAEAGAGLRKLKENHDSDVSATELLGLEAIILPKIRPVAFVRHGTYDRLKAPWEWLDAREIRELINPTLRSIGRIELPNMQSIPYGGTGFVVGPNLLMTNRHVARLFTDGVGRETRLHYRPGDAAVDFKREAFTPSDNSALFKVGKVIMVHPYWDMALIQVDGLSAKYEPLKLSTVSPDDLSGRDVVVVGYPARDLRNDAAVQDAVFEGVYNVKRLQPGKVGSRRLIRSFDYEVNAMLHDSSTLGGNSGSAVIDIKSGEVLGLHFAGEYLKANFAVPSHELARDARVVDAGVNFSRAIPSTDQWDHAWQEVGEKRKVAPPRPEKRATPPAPGAQPADGYVSPPASASVSGNGVEIPITVRISVDTGTAQHGAPLQRSSAESAKSAGRISMKQLQEMMRDPNVDDAQLRKYFIASPEISRPFAPAILPDPAVVDVALPGDALEGAMMMGWANDLSRMRRQAKFTARRNTGDRRPVLVSEGDSWFQFPVMLEDVIDHLQRDFNVWSVDASGDTLQNMVHDNAEYMKAIRMNAGSVRAFLFSGGGNDVIGDDMDGNPVISQILRPFEAGRPAEWYVENAALDAKMEFIEQCYHTLIANVAHEFPRLPIICHGYDYAIPGGGAGDSRRPIWAANDKWIGRPMRDDLGIRDARLQRDIVALLIDRLNGTIQRLCGGSNPAGTFRNAWHVDLRRNVNGRWADELHPTNEGFAAVSERFRSVLGQVLDRTNELWGGEAVPVVSPHIRARSGGAGRQFDASPSQTIPYGDPWLHQGQQLPH